VWALAKAQDGTGDWFVGVGVSLDEFRVDRYKADGILDPVFAPGRIQGNELNVLLPAPDDSGDLYMGGDFLSYNGIEVTHVLRVSREGTLR
jgi:hypothetical protein